MRCFDRLEGFEARKLESDDHCDYLLAADPRRFTLLNPPEEVREAEFNRASADELRILLATDPHRLTQTIFYWLKNPPRGKSLGGVKGLRAFQVEALREDWSWSLNLKKCLCVSACFCGQLFSMVQVGCLGICYRLLRHSVGYEISSGAWIVRRLAIPLE